MNQKQAEWLCTLDTLIPARSGLRTLAVGGPAALVGAVMVYVYAIADAALLFAIAFPDRLGQGLGMTLAGALLAGVMLLLRSGLDGVLGGTQGGVVVMMAALGAGVQAGHAPGADADAVFATVIVCFALVSLCIAAGCALVAHLGLGRFVHYLPWPVMAGFLVGTGLVLALAALAVATGSAPSALFGAALRAQLPPGQGMALLFTVLLAASLFTASRCGRPAALPLLLLCSCAAAVWHALAAPEANRAWALVGQAQVASWPPIPLSTLARVDVSQVLAAVPAIGSITIIALLMALMKAGAVGTMLRQDVDERRELSAVALGNALAGASGAMPGCHTVTGSQLLLRMRSANRATVWLLLALVLLGVPFAGWTLTAMPRFLVAAILLWIGLDLMVDWLHDHGGLLARRDVGIVALIALGIGCYGFPTGLLLGLACTVVVFLLDYSRVDVLRATLAPGDLRSNVDRTARERQVLDRHADELLVFRLRGYLFFGTAHRLLEQVRRELAERMGRIGEPLCVVLDFERVTGMDASTLRALSRFRELAHRSGFTLRVCTDEATCRVAFGGAAARAPGLGVYRHDVLDDALQAREQALLGDTRHGSAGEAHAFTSALGASLLKELAPRARLIELEAGATLVEEGACAAALYVVRSGRLEACVRRDTRSVRLRSVGPGALLGEVSLLLDGVTSARIVATEPSRVWRVSKRALAALADTDPAAALRVHRLLAATLAQRLLDNGRQLRLMAE